MDSTVIAALIGAAAVIVAAVITLLGGRKHKEHRAPRANGQRDTQCLRLGAMLACGSVVEAGGDPEAANLLRKTREMAVSLSAPDRKWMTLFRDTQSFESLSKSLEDYFRVSARSAERVHYELGTALGNLKIAGGEDPHVVKMVLDFLFVVCKDDFSSMSTLPIDKELKHLVSRLHDFQKTSTVTQREAEIIFKQVAKIWNAYVEKA